MSTRVCGRCRQEKDQGLFYSSRAARDGYDNYCKECRNADSRERNWHNSPRGKAYHGVSGSRFLPCERCGSRAGGNLIDGIAPRHFHLNVDEPSVVKQAAIGALLQGSCHTSRPGLYVLAESPSLCQR